MQKFGLGNKLMNLITESMDPTTKTMTVLWLLLHDLCGHLQEIHQLLYIMKKGKH